MVLAGCSGFCGSPDSTEKIPFGSTAALLSPLLSPPPPHAVAPSATTAAIATHLALLAPRMGLLLMSPLVHRMEGHMTRHRHRCLKRSGVPRARESAPPAARDPLIRALRA